MECAAEEYLPEPVSGPRVQEVREVIGSESHEDDYGNPPINTTAQSPEEMKAQDEHQQGDPAAELPSAIHEIEDEEEEADSDREDEQVTMVTEGADVTGCQGETLGDSTLQELLSQTDLQTLVEMLQQEHREQLAAVEAAHQQQLASLLGQQQQWLLENMSPNSSGTAEGAHFGLSPMGQVVRANCSRGSEGEDSNEKVVKELIIQKEDILTPKSTPESEKVTHVTEEYQVDSAEVSPDADEAADSSADISYGYFDESNKEKLLQKSMNRSAIEASETKDVEIQTGEMEQEGHSVEQRRLSGALSPAVGAQPAWLHEIEVPYSDTEVNLGSVLQHKLEQKHQEHIQAQDGPSDTLMQADSPSADGEVHDGIRLQQRLRAQHQERLAQMPNTPSAIHSNLMHETEFLSNVRLNLREKQARHLADLKAFYEQEVEDLKASFASSVEQGMNKSELEDAYCALNQRAAELEASLLLANSTIEEHKYKMLQLEAGMMEWQRKCEDFESQLLDARHRHDELELYSREREGFVRQLEETNHQLTMQLQEAAQLDSTRLDSMKRDQDMMHKVVRDYENLKVENEALKAKLSNTENQLYDARKEAADLKRSVGKLELEVQRLGRENDLMRHKGLSPSISISQVQRSLDETASLLENSSPLKQQLLTLNRSPPRRIGPVVSPTVQRLSVGNPAYTTRLGMSPARPSTASISATRPYPATTRLGTSPALPGSIAATHLDFGASVSGISAESRGLYITGDARDLASSRGLGDSRGLADSRNSEESRSLGESRSLADSRGYSCTADSRGLGSFVHFDPGLNSTRRAEAQSPRKTPRKTPSSHRPASAPNSARAQWKNQKTEDITLAVQESSQPPTPRSSQQQAADASRVLVYRESNSRDVDRDSDSSTLSAADLDESVVSALEKVRRGNIVSENELKLATSLPSSNKILAKAKNSKTKQLKPKNSSSEKLTDHMKMVNEMEQKFNELALEKRRVESALSRIPTAGTGAGKHHARQEQEQLEAKLDQLDKELGSIRMKMRQYHVL